MMSQDELEEHIKETVPNITISEGCMVYSTDDSFKPMLCVHLDTINTHYAPGEILPEDFEYDETLNVLGVNPNSKLSCLGGDDRAGVWIALQIINYMELTGNYNYNVGFFRDEEIGCIGSEAYLKSKDFIENTTCYLGLDRKSTQGTQEIALYGNDNQELIDVFTELGYAVEMGSITDAAVLATDDVACLNLSVGYDNEHTKNEVLHLDCMFDTFAKIKDLELYGSYPSDVIDTNPWDYSYEDSVYEDNEILTAFLENLGYNVDEILAEGVYDNVL
jgi:hypothetical protein